MNREELITYCQLVKRGKPAASIPLQEKYLEDAFKIVEQEGDLLTHIEQLSDGWLTFWVYRYPHILEIIKNSPQAPSTVYDHWILGKLFGYEEAAIQDFIQTKLF
ncbi:hypothetical protein MKZ15_05710 [Paenibacillus sp. FSL R7-0216]|uniref:hypothetical protein n=1 Tax=Paenibacillus sp. FSL R7-0216 TaxID=2921677 RepID=UPI0030D840D1